MARVWNLTAAQRKVAELIALGDPDTSRSYSKKEACELAGVSRTSLYDWLNHNKEFVEYISYVADMGMESRVGEYYRKIDWLIFDNPRGPSVKALELVLKAMGKLKDNVKVDATVNDVQTIDSKTNDELSAELEKMKKDAGL